MRARPRNATEGVPDRTSFTSQYTGNRGKASPELDSQLVQPAGLGVSWGGREGGAGTLTICGESHRPRGGGPPWDALHSR